MLTSIGEQPDNVSRAVQARGWIFNTDLDVELTTNQRDEIVVDPSILRVDTTSLVRNGDTDIVERGRKLYDRKKNTTKFTAGTKVRVDLITQLTFDSLPEPARRYIAIRAARIFHDRVVGSGELHRFFQEDEMYAWVADYNIFDNYDVFRVIDRSHTSSYDLRRNLVDSVETA
jgi:hypothetical protein